MNATSPFNSGDDTVKCLANLTDQLSTQMEEVDSGNPAKGSGRGSKRSHKTEFEDSSEAENADVKKGKR